MQNPNEQDRERNRQQNGDAELGDTNIDDASVGGRVDFDESMGGPENFVGGPSDPGRSFDPTRPLAEGANDSARSEVDPPGRDQNDAGWGDEGIAGGRAGGSGL